MLKHRLIEKKNKDLIQNMKNPSIIKEERLTNMNEERINRKKRTDIIENMTEEK